MAIYPPTIFSAFKENIRHRLPISPRIRVPVDGIPGQRVLVYQYLKDDFLDLVKNPITLQVRKQILKATLQGIAELHDRDIVHLDSKPDNILNNSHNIETNTATPHVQISDLENAAYLPSPTCIVGMLAGNDNWCSPERHFKGELDKPTDLYSFGLVCIYAILNRIILAPDADFHKHVAAGVYPAFVRLQRQVSIFGDKKVLIGLMKYVGDEETNCELLGNFWEDRRGKVHGYRLFEEWPDVQDVVFKDAIKSLCSLDPARRFTAREALGHEWFVGVEGV
ncbi:kinase-like protein [Plenodomus tracheiphilus IPT5]|uniref:Kinase-like protein n=1 Tax=Plenodomus tracheiphilus IPT5 TaxID=1408161 RepID=A0A6A7AYT0_9PLEO|nr:kinase-like protein [Plenodomus tracheiphilus IPT5]